MARWVFAVALLAVCMFALMAVGEARRTRVKVPGEVVRALSKYSRSEIMDGVRWLANNRKKIFGAKLNRDPGNGGSWSRATNWGEEGYIPQQTQLSRSRARSPSVTPSAGGGLGGAWDPFAVTGQHTYGVIPGQGLGFIGNPHQPWFMPNRKSWTECDPAIHKSCKNTPNVPLPFARGSPYPGGGSFYAMYNAPNAGWWQFHPAFSMKGSRDPLGSRVAPPQHLLSHYWSLLHPAGPGLQHAGGLNPHMAYMGNPYFNTMNAGAFHTGASHQWVLPSAISRNPYQNDEVNQYPKNWLTAAPLNMDAGANGPYAFEPPHVLGSTFMPPHIVPGPQHAVGTNGIAPSGPFDSAPAFETLRAYHASMGLTPIPVTSATSLTAPWLNPSGYSARSADPGHAANPAHPAFPVWDRINTGKPTQKMLQQPVTDVMTPGPAMLGQNPAPLGP